ncbi:hypothetical protein MLD38_008602 [Melastoma candidum]|uniref:Uncharacterized protein n=1 Tax=Melastoma candidum TaxID=119954 RepID=A0ACB9RTZ7_9MYRT|nr:hypothetical protein MLD38_008602 [Melastoma candidum]
MGSAEEAWGGQRSGRNSSALWMTVSMSLMFIRRLRSRQKAEMLSGVKFIPRDQIDREGGQKTDASAQERTERGGNGKEKLRRKKTSYYDSSDEDSSVHSTDDGYEDPIANDWIVNSVERKGTGEGIGRNTRPRMVLPPPLGLKTQLAMTLLATKIGVERAAGRAPREEIGKGCGVNEAPTEETVKINPRELNPYLKDGGSGYPEEEDEAKASGGNHQSSSVVGDGGASWRLKALKRAQEQAAREGRKLNEVVAEQWGSLGELAVSVSAGGVAPSRAHLRAINERRRGQTQDRETPRIEETDRDTRKNNRDYLKDVSLRHPEMRVPNVRDSLSWGKRRTQNMPSKDAAVISAAVSSLNKFSNDGSFMQEALRQSRENAGVSSSCEPATNEKPNLNESNKLSEVIPELPEGLTANQMTAKAMQLRMKGKHEEAEKLLQEVRSLRTGSLMTIFQTMCEMQDLQPGMIQKIGLPSGRRMMMLTCI